MNMSAPTTAPARRPIGDAHRPRPGDRERDRGQRAHPDRDLIDEHPLALPELPLHQRRGRRDGAADDHCQSEHLNDRRCAGLTHRRGERPASRYVAAAMIVLAINEIVFTVATIARGSPGQRTIARLTPSSLKLSTAISAISATA